MTLPIVHHHGFKCAGSTFVHLLNRNWLGRVLHIEHRVADCRIHCGQVEPFLKGIAFDAVTSHLLAMPGPSEELAHVHFGMVRDPIARLVSAYKFVVEERKPSGFVDFVAANKHHACDFHVRHLGMQANGTPWRADPGAVPLGEPHVLLGVVERFGDSMFLLERRLDKAGYDFDGSVGGRQNVGKGAGPDLDEAALAELRELNALDYELYERTVAELDRELLEVDPDGKGREEHRQRCAARAGEQEKYLGLGPKSWAYIED